jgi:hypothetical protein
VGSGKGWTGRKGGGGLAVQLHEGVKERYFVAERRRGLRVRKEIGDARTSTLAANPRQKEG